jgi:hypothetical protein
MYVSFFQQIELIDQLFFSNCRYQEWICILFNNNIFFETTELKKTLIVVESDIINKNNSYNTQNIKLYTLYWYNQSFPISLN